MSGALGSEGKLVCGDETMVEIGLQRLVVHR